MIMRNFNRQLFQYWATQVVFILCAITLALTVLSPNTSMKFFTAAGMVAFLGLAANVRILKDNRARWVCLLLLITGLCDFFWYAIFKNPHSPALNSYRAYLAISKICLFGCVVLSLLVSMRNTLTLNNRIHWCVAIFLQLTMILYAFYQHYYLGVPRIVFSLGGGASSTGAAYTITFISCYTLLVIQLSEISFKKLLILSHVFITFIVIFFTETRAAILVYPVVCIGLYIAYCYHHKRFWLKEFLLILLVLSAGALMMKSSLTVRYNALMSNIQSLEDNNSETSIGARIAMQKTGIAAAKGNLLWQSTDQRNHLIREMVRRDPSLSGALKYMVGHLHNEIIETWSLKGPSGVLLYILFIVALAHYAWREANSYILGAFLVSLVAFGLSSVMFYSKTTPVAWMSVMIMMIALLTQNNQSKEFK